MKNVIAFCLFVLVVFCNYSVNAKILRVGYTGPKVSGVDYNDVNSAVVAANAGDSIQLYQNSAVGSATVNKRLIFLGFGYRLEYNPNLQATPSANNGVTLNFAAGSENSVVQGVYGNFYLGANNLTISRCSGRIDPGYNSNIGNVAITNPIIVDCLWDNLYGNRGSVSNALVSNCIFSGWFYGDNLTGLISNNIFGYAVNSMGGCVVKNNIFNWAGYCISGTAAVFQNNLFASPYSQSCGGVTGSGNIYNVNLSNVFVNWNSGNYGSETNLALKTGSPAIGIGIDNNGNPTDAGIYGGEPGLVYKPSGIPAIPSIYQLSAPQLNASTNPYTITVSARSNN